MIISHACSVQLKKSGAHTISFIKLQKNTEETEQREQSLKY